MFIIMKKFIISSLLLLLCVGSMKAQQTVVNVQESNGSVTSSVLGAEGAIYFTNGGQQMAVKDCDGNVEGYPVADVAKVTFAEKEPDPTGISAPQQDQLRLYPNPTRGKVRVSGVGDSQQRMVIYSVAGTQMMEQNVAEGAEVDFSALPKGIYWVRCGEQTTKICKQ